jgi:hypothetical protein
VDFHLLASGRRTATDSMQVARVDGDGELAALALHQTVVAY